MHAFNPVEGVCAHGYRCGAGCSTCDTLAISVPSLQMKTKFKSSSGSYKRLSLVLALIFGGTMWWQIASACRESSEFGRYTEWIVRQSPHRKIETWHTMWTARQAVPITYKNPQSNEFKECPWVGQASLPFSNEDDAALATSFLKVLTETGLVFFTKAGSSLGIRRHGGFLPGDSDVDIGIPVWRNVHNLIGTEYEKYLCDDITSSAEVTLPGHERGKLCGMTSGDWMQRVFKPWLVEKMPHVPVREPFKNEKDFYMRMKINKEKAKRKLYKETRLGGDFVVHVTHPKALDMCIAPFEYTMPSKYDGQDNRITSQKVMIPTLTNIEKQLSDYYGEWQTPDRDLDDPKPRRGHQCGYMFLAVATLLILGAAYFATKTYRSMRSMICGKSARRSLSRRSSEMIKQLIV